MIRSTTWTMMILWIMNKKFQLALLLKHLILYTFYVRTFTTHKSIDTSGTTGTPKGIVRDTGGTIVALNFVMENVFDLHRGEVFFATSDIGWVVGHSFIVYGPLIRGATSVFFEGKPIIPNAGVLWRAVEEHKVKQLYVAPTAVRIVKKMDYEGKYLKDYDVSSLKGFHLVGERCDPDTILWIQSHLPHVTCNDTWW